MKKLAVIPLLLLITTANSQVLDSTRYFVTEARINKLDYSEFYFNSGQYLTFYEDDDGYWNLLNSSANQDEYSYGKVYGIKVQKVEIDNCPADDITFRWFYKNSYNNDSGYAIVRLKRIYRENGIEFSIKILSKKLDIIEFSGITSELFINNEEKEEEESDENNFKKMVTR